MSGWTPADLLPAAWLVLLAVLLGHGLGRWGVPVPALAWAAFAGVLLALFAPSLLLGRVIAPVQSLAAFPPFGELAGSPGGGNPLLGDLLLQTIPWHAAVRRLLAAGEWPLWNPWTGTGYATLRWLDGRDRASWAILALALAAVLAAGHPDTVLRLLLTAGGSRCRAYRAAAPAGWRRC